MKPKFLAVGKVLRSFGVRGEVEAKLLTDFPSRISSGLKLFLSSPMQETTSLTVQSIRLKKDRILIKFKGVDSRSQAEELTGKILQVPTEDALPLPEGNYWHYQIIGLEVLTVEGEVIGKVSDILQTGSNDVYVVSEGEKEVLVPATKEVIKEINLKAGKMVVKLIPGLLE